MDKKIADQLIEENRRNYDSFAGNFSLTRNYIPPAISSLLVKVARKENRILDIGCGNGRLYPLINGIGAQYQGIDNSEKLVEIAQKKYPQANFTVGSALDLPFKGKEFGLAVSLAVLHHIPSREYRLKFFEETYRVLDPGGFFFATVWNLQPVSLMMAGQWKRLKGFVVSQIKIIAGRAKLDLGDFFIPWQNEYQRYHHVFSLKEISDLAKRAKFDVDESGIISSGGKESNLYIIAKKPHN